VAVERVAVIGGGVTGALCAARLAQRGFDVVLLEKAAAGNGSSSRSMAGIRAQFGARESVVAMLFSKWWYVHFHELLCTPDDRRQPVIKQNGYLFLYDDPDAAGHWRQAQTTASMQRTLGVDVELLTPVEVAQHWPHLETSRLIGATWCPSDGFLFPVVIYGEGIRRAQELGTRIMQWTEVTGARQRSGRMTSLETTRGPLEVDWVINCTNAWAPRTSRVLGGMALRVEPVKRFLYHLRVPQNLLVDHWPMTIYGMGRTLGAHTRPEGQHLIMAGMSHTPAEPDFQDEDQDRVPAQFDHRHGVDNFGYRLLADIEPYAPSVIDEAEVFATTCGYYGMTPDAVPLIGYDSEISNLVHAAGFSGHGIMHAPVSALLVEALLSGDVVDQTVRLPPPFQSQTLELSAFAPGRDFAARAAETAVL
jgi:FAD-dependent oxidoreductase domain-containing protein 1